jgi:hypothetical protein
MANAKLYEQQNLRAMARSRPTGITAALCALCAQDASHMHHITSDGSHAQLTPYSSSKSRPIGRSEALTMRSAACLALSEIFRTHHASGSNPATATTPDGNQLSLSGLACMPVMIPMLTSEEDAWVGVACVGETQAFFETETMLEQDVPDLFRVQTQLQA